MSLPKAWKLSSVVGEQLDPVQELLDHRCANLPGSPLLALLGFSAFSIDFRFLFSYSAPR